MSIKIQDLVLERKPSSKAKAFQVKIPDLQINQSETVILKGKSGSGKTSLLLAIAGLISPSSGEIRVLDRDLSTLSEKDRDAFRGQNMGMIFQSHQLFTDLNVMENLLAALRFSKGKAPSAKEQQRAQSIIAQMGLADRTYHRPKELSLGQQQRVAVARAMLSEPKIILADEPTASLDASNRQEIIHLIQKFCKENGTTLVVATHDEEESWGEGLRLIEL